MLPFCMGIGSSDYQIGRSLRLRSAASAYLGRTPAAGTTGTWTLSMWVKLGKLSVGRCLLSAGTNSNNYTEFTYSSADALTYTCRVGGADNGTLTWSPKLRDTSAWTHIHLTKNGATMSLTIGGLAAPAPTGTAVTGSDTFINSAVTHGLGARVVVPDEFYDGEFAEVIFIGGSVVAVGSFAQTDANGVWSPIKYAGSFAGTGSYYLPFSDTSSTTNLVKDTSGNANNWTPNNVSLTAGVTYDSLLDTPSNNYATVNPVAINTAGVNLYSDGNLTLATATIGGGYGPATIALPTSGKWYFEATLTATTAAGVAAIGIGIYKPAMNLFTVDNACLYNANPSKTVNTVNTAYGASYTISDVIGVAVDIAGATVTFYKNGVSQGAISYTVSGDMFFTPCDGSGGDSVTWKINFGQQPWNFAPPAGYNALCTVNLPAPSIAKGSSHFDINARTGTGAIANITGYGFKPDMIWVKSRSNVSTHNIQDSVRGSSLQIAPNLTAAEVTDITEITSFNSDGFSVGTGAGAGYGVNTNTLTYVNWMWKAGGAAITNSSGSVTAQVSANAAAGFSVATFNAGGAGNQSFGHGLGVAPQLVLLKDRVNGATNWSVYHSAVCTATDKFLNLNLTVALGSAVGIWGAALPTSTIVGFGSGVACLANANCVAYCFAEIAGFSKIGSYVGTNVADGPFIYLGFRPKFVMVKCSSAVEDWVIHDAVRNTSNALELYLYPDTTAAEAGSGTARMDFCANGIKLRNSGQDNTANTYVFIAFAESPFKYARAR